MAIPYNNNTADGKVKEKWKRGRYPMSIGMMIICVVGGLAGALSTAYLMISFPVIIVWKIYRCIKLGCTMFDWSWHGRSCGTTKSRPPGLLLIVYSWILFYFPLLITEYTRHPPNATNTSPTIKISTIPILLSSIPSIHPRPSGRGAYLCSYQIPPTNPITTSIMENMDQPSICILLPSSMPFTIAYLSSVLQFSSFFLTYL